MEQLGTSSSIGSDDDDWVGIYADTYLSFSWIYITDADEALPWCHSTDDGKILDSAYLSPNTLKVLMFWIFTDEAMLNYQQKQKTFCDITDSENEFHSKYEVVINNIVHRRMSLELQKCLSKKSFSENWFSKSWLVCSSVLLKAENFILGNIRRVVVCRDSSEYGFRIRGSRPVIVSVVESASPAAYAGLEVGDVILYINNYNVLNASHSDVLKIFQDCKHHKFLTN